MISDNPATRIFMLIRGVRAGLDSRPWGNDWSEGITFQASRDFLSALLSMSKYFFVLAVGTISLKRASA